MNIPMKYEDVVAKLDAALGREAALREDLEESEEENSNLREVIRDIKNWREVSQSSAALSSLLKRADEIKNNPSPLQQRLTVAERHFDILFEASLGLLSCVEQGLYTGHDETELRSAVDEITGFRSALKPAAGGEGS